MSNEERINKIFEFLDTQRHLHGLKAGIREEGNGFVIEFEEASQRQLITLNRTLQNAEMKHIRATAKKVIQFENKKR
jgi:hypothetical protein